MILYLDVNGYITMNTAARQRHKYSIYKCIMSFICSLLFLQIYLFYANGIYHYYNSYSIELHVHGFRTKKIVKSKRHLDIVVNMFSID